MLGKKTQTHYPAGPAPRPAPACPQLPHRPRNPLHHNMITRHTAHNRQRRPAMGRLIQRRPRHSESPGRKTAMPTGRSSESMSTNTRCSMPGSSGVRCASAARCARATAASWLAWPKVNSRKKIPNVDGAYTSSIPGACRRRAADWHRRRCPHHTASRHDRGQLAGRVDRPGLDPHRRQVHVLAYQFRKPRCSANSSTGTNPAAETRSRSSNTADPTVNVCDDCTENAFRYWVIETFDNA